MYKQRMLIKRAIGLAFAGFIAFTPLSLNMPKVENRLGLGASRGGEIKTNIQNFKNLRAHLEKVKITAIGTTTITVDNAGTSVTINILGNTQLRRRFWGKSSLSEFSVGDSVDVIGKWTDNTKTAVNAVLIRDESIQKRFGVFFGTVKSISGGTFVVSTIHRDDETVTIGTAKLINRRQQPINSGDIVVGARVRVRGLWDSNLKTITQVTEIKDFSLPPLGSGEPEESEKPHATTAPTVVPTASPVPSVSPSPTP